MFRAAEQCHFRQEPSTTSSHLTHSLPKSPSNSQVTLVFNLKQSSPRPQQQIFPWWVICHCHRVKCPITGDLACVMSNQIDGWCVPRPWPFRADPWWPRTLHHRHTSTLLPLWGCPAIQNEGNKPPLEELSQVCHFNHVLVRYSNNFFLSFAVPLLSVLAVNKAMKSVWKPV